MTDKQKRCVGLDVHKHYVMVGAVNLPKQKEPLNPWIEVGLVQAVFFSAFIYAFFYNLGFCYLTRYFIGRAYFGTDIFLQ